ncbi:MAG: hypothetical protein SVK54_04410 [candidate division WOR-3 bacterium]|nr:hypothetical protein [candidate division WOR-3 bacterium]
MDKTRIALLSQEEKLISEMQSENNTDIYSNYLKLITSIIIKKYSLVILDSMQMPFFNEQKIIRSINDLCRNTRIIFIARDNDPDLIARIHDRNNIAYTMHYPLNFAHLTSIVKHIISKKNH